MAGGAKPKVRRESPTLKKRIATGVATGLIVGALSFGATELNTPLRTSQQRGSAKATIESIGEKNIEVPKSNSKNPNLIRETVSSYNQKAKIGQIFFYDGKKINSVYFDQIKLNQIIKLLPQKEKATIDSLVLRKIKQVESTAKQNVILSKKIIDRVGELDYAKYLLSLTPRELKNAFPEAETAVRKALENSNPKILKQIRDNDRLNKYSDIVWLSLLSFINGFVWARGKRTKPQN